MTEIKLAEELLQVMKNIQLELQLMNKTLSGIAVQSKQPSSDAESRPFPARGAKGIQSSRTEGGKPYRSAKSEGGGFPARKGSTRGTGKPPAKKGSGYPKKPR